MSRELVSLESKTSSFMSLIKSGRPASDEEKEVAALERLDELEACLTDMEGKSDKVFRASLADPVNRQTVKDIYSSWKTYFTV